MYEFRVSPGVRICIYFTTGGAADTGGAGARYICALVVVTELRISIYGLLLFFFFCETGTRQYVF